jgi:asparagine synthase (glutamine-hydrolysing)
MFHTTPESINEQLPHFDNANRVSITADARIDNRDELIGQLLLTDRPQTEVTDGELLIHAYRRWGRSCARYIAGDFAFALWDAQENSMFCARDRFGVKPLFYYRSNQVFAFASEIKALLSLPEVPHQPNDRMIAEHLSGTHCDREITFYRDIVRLVPAHTLEVSYRGAKQQVFWSLDPDRELKLKGDREYEEAFREKFTQAVRRRLRSHLPFGVTLSGGLDSSSIAGVAQRELKAAGRRGLVAFSGVFDLISECDERKFIEKVVARAGMESRYVPGDGLSPLADLDQVVLHADNPVFSPNLFLHWALHRAASSEGFPILLDGFDGDTVVSHGLQFLNELASQNRWLRLARENHAFCRKMGLPAASRFKRYALHFGLEPWAARAQSLEQLARLVRPLRRKPAVQNHRQPTWQSILDKDFATRMDVIERNRAWRRSQPISAATEREGHYRLLTQPNLPMALEILGSTAAAFATESRYPFWDHRLVELCLSLPGEQKLKGGLGRSIMRRALSEVLPVEIQRRPGKTNFVPALYNGLIAIDRQRVESLIATSDELDQYVDRRALESIYQRLSSVSRDYAPGADLLSLWNALSLAQWLKTVHSRPRMRKGGESNVILTSAPNRSASRSSNLGL